MLCAFLICMRIRLRSVADAHVLNNGVQDLRIPASLKEQ